MKISASIILRDQINTIRRCLESIKPYCEEIVIVLDTRSTADLIPTLNEYGCKVYPYDWQTDSFADARNFAASKCSGEWLLTIDGDEILSSMFDTDLLPEGIQYVNCILKTFVEDSVLESKAPRLLKKDVGIVYEVARHERLTLKGFKGATVDNFIVEAPPKSKEEILKKTKWLLKSHFKQLETEPDNGYLPGQIAGCYQTLGETRKAIDWYFTALLSDVPDEVKANACISLFACYSIINEPDFAKYYLRYSLYLCPQQYWAHSIWYEHYSNVNDTGKMNEIKQKLIDIKNNGGSRLVYDLPFPLTNKEKIS